MRDVSGSLYQEYSWLYNEIARDRDFLSEIKRLGLHELPKESTFVELFAGPAYHCCELAKIRPDINIVAIDNSPEMLCIAEANGFSGTYIVDDVSAALSNINEAEFVFAPRYSLVLISAEEVHDLFSILRKTLTSQGVFVAEIHPDSMADPDSYIAGNWKKLDIYERYSETASEHLTCRWPATLDTVSLDPLVLRMGIEVDIKNCRSEEIEYLYFESVENIHSYNTLLAISQKTGLVLQNKLTQKSKNSSFVAWSSLGYVGSLTSAMSGPFDISSVQICQDHLSRSGLSIADHNRVLNSHVYNLL